MWPGAHNPDVVILLPSPKEESQSCGKLFYYILHTVWLTSTRIVSEIAIKLVSKTLRLLKQKKIYQVKQSIISLLTPKELTPIIWLTILDFIQEKHYNNEFYTSV